MLYWGGGGVGKSLVFCCRLFLVLKWVKCCFFKFEVFVEKYFDKNILNKICFLEF